MTAQQQAKPISASELRRYMEKHSEDSYTLVDVRQKKEYLQERLPGAVHLPVGELHETLATLPPEKDYIFYCQVGARSAAAVLLAEDKQHFTGSLYTLTGGLNAWSGFAVAEAPRLATFDEHARPELLVLQAIDMEKAAHQLYTTIRNAAPNDRLCELMDSLVEIEMAHAKLLYRRLQEYHARNEKAAPLPPFEALFASLEGKVLEGGFTLEDLRPWITAAIQGDCYDVADLALEMEMNAYDLYRTLAHRAQQHVQQLQEQAPHNETADASGSRTEPDSNQTALADAQEAAALYTDLAEQEKKHARMIMRHMDAFD